jgi:hypothetical protein
MIGERAARAGLAILEAILKLNHDSSVPQLVATSALIRAPS